MIENFYLGYFIIFCVVATFGIVVCWNFIRKYLRYSKNAAKIKEKNIHGGILSAHVDIFALLLEEKMICYELFKYNNKKKFRYYWDIVRGGVRSFYIEPCIEEKTITAIVNHYQMYDLFTKIERRAAIFEQLFLSFLVGEDLMIMQQLYTLGAYVSAEKIIITKQFLRNITLVTENNNVKYSLKEEHKTLDDDTFDMISNILVEVEMNA